MCIAATNRVAGRLVESPFSDYSDPVVTASDIPLITQVVECETSGPHFLRLAIPIPNDNGATIESYSIAVFQVEKTLGLTNSRLISDEDFAPTQFTIHPRFPNDFLLCEIQGLQAQSSYSIRYAATNRIGKSEYSTISAEMRTSAGTVPALLDEVYYIYYRYCTERG